MSILSYPPSVVAAQSLAEGSTVGTSPQDVAPTGNIIRLVLFNSPAAASLPGMPQGGHSAVDVSPQDSIPTAVCGMDHPVAAHVALVGEHHDSAHMAVSCLSCATALTDNEQVPSTISSVPLLGGSSVPEDPSDGPAAIDTHHNKSRPPSPSQNDVTRDGIPLQLPIMTP
jgi:hypothetical protein